MRDRIRRISKSTGGAGRLAVVLTAAVALGVPPAVIAQGTLEEIIVTAQKRTESLQDVPISIQAVSGDQLSTAGVGNLSVLEQISPSITMNDATGYALASVRGVGSTNQGHGNYSSVAIYIDDVYVTRASSGMFSMANVEQLQVLKGPQGSLYGRNATGGALVITTNTPRPGDEFAGNVSATVGDFDRREFVLSLSGGFSDRFAASFDIATQEHDGFLDTVTPGRIDLDGRDALSAVGKLVFAPTDNAELEFSLWYDESDDTSAHGYQQVNVAPNPAFGGLNGPQALLAGFIGGLIGDPVAAAMGAATIQFVTPFGRASDNEFGGFATFPGVIPSGDNGGRAGSFTFTEDWRASFKATVEFPKFDLVTILAATDSDYEAATDVLGAVPGSVATAFPFLAGDNLGFSAIFGSESKSQEIRLVSNDSRIEWLAGIYNFTDEGDTLLNADTFGLSFRQSFNEWEVDSLAAFGQVKIPFGDAFNLTLGARYTDEDYELTDRMGGSTGFADVDGPIFEGIALAGIPSVQQINALAPGTFPTEQNFSQITGGVTLDWSNDNLLIYGSVNTGFKSGNLNANNPLSGGVDPEEITAVEVGVKSELADGRVRLNGSVFAYDYENIHLQVINQNSGATILINGSNAEIFGAEVEVVALIADGLTFDAALTVLDSEYKDDVLVPNGNPFGGDLIIPISGNDVAGAPETALTLGLEYVRPLAAGELVFNANALVSDGYFFEAENRVGTGGIGAGSYTTVNANVMYRTDRWNVALWANNLTDEEYYRGGIVANALIEAAIAARPAHYGLTFGINF